jgi:hypothetical protein
MTAVVIVFTFAGERFVGLVAEDIAEVVYSETAFSSARAWAISSYARRHDGWSKHDFPKGA